MIGCPATYHPVEGDVPTPRILRQTTFQRSPSVKRTPPSQEERFPDGETPCGASGCLPLRSVDERRQKRTDCNPTIIRDEPFFEELDQKFPNGHSAGGTGGGTTADTGRTGIAGRGNPHQRPAAGLSSARAVPGPRKTPRCKTQRSGKSGSQMIGERYFI